MTHKPGRVLSIFPTYHIQIVYLEYFLRFFTSNWVNSKPNLLINPKTSKSHPLLYEVRGGCQFITFCSAPLITQAIYKFHSDITRIRVFLRLFVNFRGIFRGLCGALFLRGGAGWSVTRRYSSRPSMPGPKSYPSRRACLPRSTVSI